MLGERHYTGRDGLKASKHETIMERLSNGFARFNGCDGFGCDGNLVKRWHSAIHNYPRHDLAGERVRTKVFHAHDIGVMEGSNGIRNKSGFRIEPGPTRGPAHFDDQ